MKSANDWAAEIRSALGNHLRADPVLVSKKTLIEEIVEDIQKDARKDFVHHTEWKNISNKT